MLKHLFDALYSFVRKDIMYQKMKKEIMDLPAHKFTTENKLVRIKDIKMVLFYFMLY